VAKLEEQFEAISQRFTNVEARLDRIETRLGTGLTEVKGSIVRLEGRLDSGLAQGRTELARLHAEMNTQFRWLMGGIGVAVLTALAAMLRT
jgi:hypothetical protein